MVVAINRLSLPHSFIFVMIGVGGLFMIDLKKGCDRPKNTGKKFPRRNIVPNTYFENLSVNTQ